MTYAVLHDRGRPLAFATLTTSGLKMSPLLDEDASTVATSSAVEQGRYVLPLSLLNERIAEAAALALESDEQLPPTSIATREAWLLLEMMPSNISPPEPVIEPSGAIAWTWERDDGPFLVLAVNGTGRLQHSAIIDGQQRHGSRPMSDRLEELELGLLARFAPAHA